MNHFIRKISGLFGVPIVMLIVLYVVSDPFRTIYPFKINNCYDGNRDVISTELFVLNYPDHLYDSFLFGSCKSCSINSYHWKKYLPTSSKQYVFQAWGETITGIKNKLCFLDEMGVSIKNTLVLIDIPSSFGKKQVFFDAILMQSPRTTKMSPVEYQFRQFCNFAQKPSIWLIGLKRMRTGVVSLPNDIVSNDWSSSYSSYDLDICPSQDSLKRYPVRFRDGFIKKADNFTDEDLNTSEPLISGELYENLLTINKVFKKHNTNAKLFITPGYCYTSSSINSEDLDILRAVFGGDNVIDFSHKNYLNSDYNNYYDPDHFGLCVGWHMIEDVYNSQN